MFLFQRVSYKSGSTVLYSPFEDTVFPVSESPPQSRQSSPLLDHLLELGHLASPQVVGPPGAEALHQGGGGPVLKSSSWSQEEGEESEDKCLGFYQIPYDTKFSRSTIFL